MFLYSKGLDVIHLLERMCAHTRIHRFSIPVQVYILQVINSFANYHMKMHLAAKILPRLML